MRLFSAAGRAVLLVFALAVVLGSAPTAAQTGPLPVSLRDASVEQLQQSIDRQRALGGYDDMSPLAHALLQAALPVAGAVAEYAAPGDPQLHWQGFVAAAGAGQLGRAARALIEALWAAASDPWIQLRLLSLVTAATAVGAWSVVLALVAIVAVARGSLLLHDYADSFPRRLRRVVPLCLGFLVAATMWTAGVGPALLLVLCGLVFTPYMHPRGRIAFGVAVAVACLAPLNLSWLGRETMAAGKGAWGVYRVWRGDSGADLMAELQQTLHPEADHRSYLLARVARRNGDLQQAADLLEGARRQPAAGMLEMERGNLHFLSGRLEQALAAYRHAAAQRPQDPAPQLNQHSVHLRLLQLEQADAALALARAADPGEAEVLERRLAHAGGELLPLSHTLPRRWVAEEYFCHRRDTPTWVTGLTASLVLDSPLVRAEYLGGVALLLALLAGRSGGQRRSRYCPSCGFVVCPRCSRRIKGSLLCAACWTVDHEKEVDAAERERRQQAAERWRRRGHRWRRVGHLLLPGWSDFVYGRRWFGLWVGTLWSLGAGLAAVALAYPVPLFPWGGQLHWAAGAALLLLAHGAGAWRGVRPQ